MLVTVEVEVTVSVTICAALVAVTVVVLAGTERQLQAEEISAVRVNDDRHGGRVLDFPRFSLGDGAGEGQVEPSVVVMVVDVLVVVVVLQSDLSSRYSPESLLVS